MALADEVLLTQYKQGDPRAFRVLVERYTAPLFNLAFRLLRDSMEAEDVTQETFLRVVAALERVRLDLPFKPYLFRIAVNLCRDSKRRKQPVLFSDLDHAGARNHGGEGEPASESIADDAPPLWERLEREELHAQLHAAMEHLPPFYQTVLILRYVEDFSYEEIAQTLDLPLNTVRTQLRRAKERLRFQLEQHSRRAASLKGSVQFRAAEGGSA